MKGKKIKYRKELSGHVNANEQLSVTPFEFAATFLEFGVQAYTTNFGVAQTSIAIIMLPDGTVVTTHPEHIRFV